METPQLYNHNGRLYPDNIRPKLVLVEPVHLRGLYKDVFNDYESKADILICEDTAETIKHHLDGAHALIGCPQQLFDASILSASNRSLKWVHNPGAGVEYLLFKEFVEAPIVFTNGRVIQGPECADHAMALLLSLTRNIASVLRGKKKNELDRPIELYKKNALVIGSGGIGLCIAERAAGFGMKVTLVNPDSVPMLNCINRVIRPKDMLSVLPDMDAVLMAAPHTYQTHKMFSEPQFSTMKNGSFFINVSRGGTVDTDALLAAIESKRLRGVGLDVTDPEPLPLTHPLNHFENVIITPHIAGLSGFNRTRSVAVIHENVGRFIEGRSLINQVNKNLGY